jgi:hypothetical protein
VEVIEEEGVIEVEVEIEEEDVEEAEEEVAQVEDLQEVDQKFLYNLTDYQVYI